MSNSPNAATILPPAPPPAPAPKGDLQAAIAAMQASMAAGEAASAGTTAAPPPAAPPQPPAAAPASTPQPPAPADPSRPPAPTEGADDRYTRLYASLTETDRQLQELRRVNAELQGRVVDPQAIESLSVADRLKRVGLTHEQVFDAWTGELAGSAPAATGQPSAPPAGQDAVLQRIEALQAEIASLKDGNTKAAERAQREQLEATATSVILAEAQKGAEAYPYFVRLQQASYRDEHGRTPAQLAIVVGEQMMQLTGGVRPTFEQVLGAVEDHYRQRAQLWAPQQGTTPPGPPASPPTQQTQARPVAPLASPGGDTPEPRELTEAEKHKEAVRILRQRLEAQDRGAGQ